MGMSTLYVEWNQKVINTSEGEEGNAIVYWPILMYMVFSYIICKKVNDWSNSKRENSVTSFIVIDLQFITKVFFSFMTKNPKKLY